MDNKADNTYITTMQAAKLLGVSRVTVFKRIKSGQLRAKKIGRNYSIRRKEIEAFLPRNGGVTSKEEKEIKESVSKSIKEYGEAIRMLGKE